MDQAKRPPNPHFIAAIGRNLRFWSEQLKTGDDYETSALLPQHNEILFAARYAIQITAYHIDLAHFIEQYFAFIEQSKFQTSWLPISGQLIDSRSLQTNPPLYHNTILRHATLLRLDGDRQAAIELLNQHIPNVDSPLLLGKMLLNTAVGYYRSDRLHQGIEFAKESLEKFEQCQNQKWIASCQLELGNMLTDLGHFEKAEKHLTAANLFEQNHQDPTRIVRTYNSLAHLYSRQGQPYKALATILSAQPYLNGITRYDDAAWVKINTAVIYNELGQYQKALALLLTTEKMQPHLPDPTRIMAFVYSNLTVSAYNLNQFDDVVAYAQHAIVRFKRLNENASLGRAQLNLAAGYQELNQLDEAKQAHAQAVGTLTASPKTAWVLELLQEADQFAHELYLNVSAEN